MRHDRLYDLRWREIRQVAFSWIDQLDRIAHKRPAQVVGGLAVVFLLVCERFKADPRRVLETAERILRRAQDTEPMYPGAIRDYLRSEMPNDG